MRRWLLIPSLCYACAWLVLFKGGDALSVCFNTIALLLLLDIDNLTYHVGFAEVHKALCEKEGRVYLDEKQGDRLVKLKAIYEPSFCGA